MRLPCRSFVAVVALAVAFAYVVTSGVRSTAAHGEAAVTVQPNPAPVGSTITIEGEEFEPDVDVAISLEGITGSTPLGTTMTDAGGAFMVEVDLPETAPPGSYRVRAEGADDVALFDFRISAGTGGAQPEVGHERSIGFHREAPADQILGLAVFAGVLAIIGAALLLMRRESATSSKQG